VAGCQPSMRVTPVELLVAAVRSVTVVEVALAPEIAPVTTPAQSLPLADPFAGAVARHRVAQLLAPYAETLGLAPNISEMLRREQRRSQLEALGNAADTIHVSTVLERAGVAHLVLKGVALAQQTTGSSVARGAGDVDVLVDQRHLSVAVNALVASGMQRDAEFCPPPDSPLFPAVSRTQMELVLCHRGREVDLHWRLDLAPAGLSWHFEELVESAEWIAVGGVTLPTLGRLHAAIFNSAHGARDAWSQLRGLVDQVRLNQGLDENALIAEAWRVGAGRRMELGLAMTAKLLGTDPPCVSATSRTAADHLWAWILAGEEPRGRRGAKAGARILAVNLLTHDSPRAAAQRGATLIWPVRAMAKRSLGDVGDRHPWLYPAATPYFLPRRALAKAGLIEAER
jgi:hypothetical protein